MRVLTSRDKTLVMPVTREKTSHRFVYCVVLMLLYGISNIVSTELILQILSLERRCLQKLQTLRSPIFRDADFTKLTWCGVPCGCLLWCAHVDYLLNSSSHHSNLIWMNINSTTHSETQRNKHIKKVNTNFEGADVRGVSFEDTSMDNANLKDIVAVGSYFGQSLVDVKTLENGDFTDATIPPKTLKQVCDREDVKGTNPTTGADTRDSLMCL